MPKEKLIPQEKPTEYDMEVTPERALRMKLALIRQYEDQYGVKVISFTENGKKTILPEAEEYR